MFVINYFLEEYAQNKQIKIQKLIKNYLLDGL